MPRARRKINRAITLYKKGIRVADIIAETGVSSASLYCYLKELGVKPRNHYKSEGEVRTQQIIDAYEGGLNINKIAVRYKISIFVIIKILRKNDSLCPSAVGCKSEDNNEMQ